MLNKVHNFVFMLFCIIQTLPVTSTEQPVIDSRPEANLLTRREDMHSISLDDVEIRLLYSQDGIELGVAIVHEDLRWKKALDTCSQKYNGALLALSDFEINNMFEEYMDVYGTYWIGLRKHGNSFAWNQGDVEDAATLVIDKFAKHQIGKCVSIKVKAKDDVWQLDDCSKKKPFLCQFQPECENVGGGLCYRNSKLCLPDDAICDGVSDCLNGLDEHGCEECVHNFTVAIGEVVTITSPAYPRTYPVRIECQWTLLNIDGNQLSVTFVDFSVEDGFDFLSAGSGDRPGQNSSAVWMHSGNQLPRNFISDGDSVWITFSSDFAITEGGFYAIVTGLCRTTLIIPAGGGAEVTSLNYPMDYLNRANCMWVVRTEAHTKMRVQHLSFDIEECCDFYYAGNGDSVDEESAIIWKYSGSEMPNDFVSVSDTVWFRFTSDDNIVAGGFRVKVSDTGLSSHCSDMCGAFNSAHQCSCHRNCIQEDNCCYDYFDACARNCHHEMSIAPGDYVTLTSPNFPNKYPNNIECEWLLESAEGRTTMEVDFYDFHVERNYDLFYAGVGSRPLLNTSVIWGYSGDTTPDGFLSVNPGGKIWLRFISDESEAGEGFKILVTALSSSSSCVGQCGGCAETCCCDGLCAVFGDCCKDYVLACNESPNEITTEKPSIPTSMQTTQHMLSTEQTTHVKSTWKTSRYTTISTTTQDPSSCERNCRGCADTCCCDDLCAIFKDCCEDVDLFCVESTTETTVLQTSIPTSLPTTQQPTLRTSQRENTIQTIESSAEQTTEQTTHITSAWKTSRYATIPATTQDPSSCEQNCRGCADTCCCDNLCAIFKDCCEDFDLFCNELPTSLPTTQQPTLRTQRENTMQTTESSTEQTTHITSAWKTSRYTTIPATTQAKTCVSFCGTCSEVCCCESACELFGDCCPDLDEVCS